MHGDGADTQRAETPPGCALSGRRAEGGWAYLPSVSTMTFLPRFLSEIQFAVMTLRGNGSGTCESRTRATVVRVRQRAVHPHDGCPRAALAGAAAVSAQRHLREPHEGNRRAGAAAGG